MDDKKTKAGRRGFLIGAGSAGIAGAAAAAVGGKAGAGAGDKVAAKPDTKGRGGGYHVTDHVRSYYRTTLV